MLIAPGTEALAHKVAHMAEDNEDEVADVGGEEDVVGRVLDDMGGVGCPWGVCAGDAVLCVGTVAKLGMEGLEDLLRGGWVEGEGEGVVLDFCGVEDGVV